jgi:hypothetical protein
MMSGGVIIFQTIQEVNMLLKNYENSVALHQWLRRCDSDKSAYFSCGSIHVATLTDHPACGL